jgi:hypothetical protein
MSFENLGACFHRFYSSFCRFFLICQGDFAANAVVLDKDTVNISFDKKTMFIVNNQEFYPIYFSSEQDFFLPDLPFDLRFEKDADGRVKDIYFKNRGKEFRANKL